MKYYILYVAFIIDILLILSIPSGYSYLHHRDFSPLMQHERRRGFGFGSRRHPLCKSGTRPGSSCEPGPNSPYCHYYDLDQFGARSTCVCDRELHKYKCWLIILSIDCVNSPISVIATKITNFVTWLERLTKNTIELKPIIVKIFNRNR